MANSNNPPVPPAVQRWLDLSLAFHQTLPHLTAVAVKNEADFRGVHVFLGDLGDWLGVVKKFDDEGAPVKIFTSGSDPLTVFLNLNKAIQGGHWKPDKQDTKP